MSIANLLGPNEYNIYLSNLNVENQVILESGTDQIVAKFPTSPTSAGTTINLLDPFDVSEGFILVGQASILEEGAEYSVQPGQAGTFITVSNAISHSVGITLPPVAQCNGLTFKFINRFSGGTANTVVFVAHADETGFYGNQITCIASAVGSGTGSSEAASITINTNSQFGDTVSFSCDGVSWYFIGIGSATGWLTFSP